MSCFRLMRFSPFILPFKNNNNNEIKKYSSVRNTKQKLPQVVLAWNACKGHVMEPVERSSRSFTVDADLIMIPGYIISKLQA